MKRKRHLKPRSGRVFVWVGCSLILTLYVVNQTTPKSAKGKLPTTNYAGRVLGKDFESECPFVCSLWNYHLATYLALKQLQLARSDFLYFTIILHSSSLTIHPPSHGLFTVHRVIRTQDRRFQVPLVELLSVILVPRGRPARADVGA